MNIEQFIQQHVSRCIESLYGDTGGAGPDTEDPQGVRGRHDPRRLPAAQAQPQESRGYGRGDRQRFGRRGTGNQRLQRDQRLPEHFALAPLLGRTAERNPQYARLRPPCSQRSHGHGRVLLAEHEQAAAFGARAQQPARLLRVADTRSGRLPRHQGQPRERPGYSHLQVDARMAEVRPGRDARLVGQEGRSPRRRLLRRFRQGLQGRGERAHGRRHERGGGQARGADHARGAADAPPVGSQGPGGVLALGNDERLGLRGLRQDLRGDGRRLR